MDVVGLVRGMDAARSPPTAIRSIDCNTINLVRFMEKYWEVNPQCFSFAALVRILKAEEINSFVFA